MKGQVKIQLFDKDGNLKEEVNKSNLITSAIESILNPPFEDFFECYNDIRINTNKKYCPISKNLLGGIFLFNSVRTQTEDHILPTAEDFLSYIGSAGGTFTGTTSKIKGSLNLNETGAVENGYKYVWDFGTGSAFRLESLSLTSLPAGNVGMDFDFENDTSTGEIFGKYGVKLDGSNNNTIAVGANNNFLNNIRTSIDTDGFLCYVSNDFKEMVLGKYENNTYVLTKYIFRDRININDDFNVSSYEMTNYSNWEKDYIYTVAPSVASLQSNLDLIFWDDIYIYSVNPVYNSNNKSLTINIVKIDADSMVLSEQKQIVLDWETSIAMNSYILCDGGDRLLINDKTNKKVYVINTLYNRVDNTISYETKDNSYELYLCKFTDDLIGLYRGYRSNYMYLIDLQTMSKTLTKLSSVSDTNLDYYGIKSMRRLGNSPIFVSKSSSSKNDYLNLNLFEGFFASIFNLDVAINKTETDTLKISYTITN